MKKLGCHTQKPNPEGSRTLFKRAEAKMFSAALAKQFKSLYSSELPEAAR